jgi:hypothetical protein
LPYSSGNKITNELPVSGVVVIVKSVPNTKTSALGVDIFIFFLLLNLPVTKRAVPLANRKAISDFLGFGSYMYELITSLL